MSDKPASGIQFLLPPGSRSRGIDHDTPSKDLPSILGGRSRAARDNRDPFINDHVVSVEAVFDLAGAARGVGDSDCSKWVDDNRVLALEATDGTTLIVRADKLKADLARLYPDQALRSSANGELLDLSVLHDQEAAARGVGSWIWSSLTVLDIAPDSLVEAAKDKARDLLKETLGEAFLTAASKQLIEGGASWAGTKALMWAIESKLDGEPGLYRWGSNKQIQPHDRVTADEPALLEAAANNHPILIFIHGTASSTLGSYGSLREGNDEGCWDNLTRDFAGHVYGFEHRTFSESPLENALQLARTLPKGANISLITHSRGGLVGDLLCIGEITDDMISRYQRKPVLDRYGQESDENRRLREAVAQQERQQLKELRSLLESKQFNIRRYMRVACPASGTSLLADNLDLFLSGLLSLINTAVGLLPVVGTIGGATLSALRRIVLEIARNRIDPQLIPGIEAMLPSSPMTVLLAQAKRRDGVDMAVIAGNADGDGGSFLKRIAVMLTDWIIFDRFDNDFVVDTQSMRAGLARRNKTREFYVQGSQVSHIHYFARPDTRRALCRWMTEAEPQSLPAFNPIPTDYELKLDEVHKPPVDRSAEPVSSDAPIIIYLPGIMGSHLEIAKPEQGKGEGDRVWFDPFDLAAGGIGQISLDKAHVRAESLFQRYYGDLENYLTRDNKVLSFAYDWRLSIEASADELAVLIVDTLETIQGQRHRQVSLLAHSMGGLVVRAMIIRYPDLWEKLVTEYSSQFVMLGTPNHGSHQMVENLIGKGRAVRQLAALDFHHELQEIIEIIGEFDGVLQLLPPDSFTDTGLKALAEGYAGFNYQGESAWKTIRSKNEDRWFGYDEAVGLGAMPSSKSLKAAAQFWKTLDQHDTDKGLPHANKVAYVFGLDSHTPSGLSHKGDHLYLHGTVRGDGSVSWESGQLKPLTDNDRYWYMPVPHSELTGTDEYFPAIAELLSHGKTQQLLKKPPRTRSTSADSYIYNAGPVLQPGAEDIALSFFGGTPHREAEPDTTQILNVSVRAMDLRFAQHPVMCGHYMADPISGAEAQIDHHLVNDALSQRERLGIYAGEIGTSTIVLNSRSAEDRRRGSGQGAIVIGLGDWSLISAERLTNSVRNAVLQFLLQTNDCDQGTPPANGKSGQPTQLTINSLLVGYNSTTHITVGSSIDAIVRGVCEANQQYRYNTADNQTVRAIGALEFIEFYMDTAITAAYSVRELPHRLEKDLKQLQARIIPEAALQFNDGMRQRLSERSSGNGYWSRMLVTDADEQETEGPAERIKYVYLSERARAEAIIQQRQPGLIEALIKEAIKDNRYDKNICRTLFQLMVPVDFKSTARQTKRLLLVVDGYTANLPWEMLQADDEPLAQKIAMVRQLVSTRFRKSVVASNLKTACVIGNPATTGFHRHFVTDKVLKPEDDGSLISLSGAVKEAQQVTQVLRDNDYTIETLYPKNAKSPPQHSAIDVFNVLFKKPYRILMIAAHGEVKIRANDGKERTGVVLSDGVMLTAAEVGQMEVVPDLVFLNCCHLGKLDASPTASYNRLAYSISRELIEMGVRCVVAAGWAVDDDAACTFSDTFFKAFVQDSEPFGEALFKARKITYKMHPTTNTWGAYQAYGDPNYVLRVNTDKSRDNHHWTPVAPQELKQYLQSLLVDIQHYKDDEEPYTFERLTDKIDNSIARVPQEWIQTPGTQYLLARLYGSILPEGFKLARAACQRAIFEEDKDGQVPIVALQQLGNLEARQAEALSAEAEALLAEIKGSRSSKDKQRLKEQSDRQFQEALALADSAIERLQGLLKITDQMHSLVGGTGNGNAGSERFTPNAERFALLGSALKYKAIVLSRRGDSWSDIEPLLAESAEAYGEGEGVSFDANFDPYAMINRLQLCGILGQPVPNIRQLIDKSQEASRLAFKRKPSFFSAVGVADAEVAHYLLAADSGNSQKLPDASELIQLYRDALSEMPHSNRQFFSTIKQLICLAGFLDKRADSVEDKTIINQRARVIKAVALELKKL